jgi:sugar phosphate isomerase/epimerase
MHPTGPSVSGVLAGDRPPHRPGWPHPRHGYEPDISLAAVSFGGRVKTGQMSTEEFLDEARRLGFRAVELCDRTVGDPGALGEALAARGLTMPSIALRNDFTGGSEATAESVAHLGAWLDVAQLLGCRTARVWTGWQHDDGSTRREIVAAFDRVVEVAAGLGIGLAVETHGGASNDPRFLSLLCERYAGHRFGVCVDFGNIPPPRRRDVIAAVAGYTSHVHVKAYQFDDHGIETTVPLDWAVRAVAAAGFRGQWVIEYEGAPPWPAGIDHTVRSLRQTLQRP